MYECAAEFARSLILEANSKDEEIRRLEAEIRELEEQAEELRFNPNHDPENGRFTSGSGVDISGGSGIISKSTVNAVGKPVEIVEFTEIKGKPNSITQRETAKGGIDRNYYGDDGMQTKQISNNGHGHKVEEKLGKHGEHAHDYYRDDGKIHHGKARELNDEERKENDDIL